MPPPDDIPDDLITALARLHAERPGSWLDVVADAVAGIGGTDAADLLGMAADRAASGLSRGEEADPEAALANLEADLKELDDLHRMDGPSEAAKAVDLLADLPPAPTSAWIDKSPRNMGN